MCPAKPWGEAQDTGDGGDISKEARTQPETVMCTKAGGGLWEVMESRPLPQGSGKATPASLHDTHLLPGKQMDGKPVLFRNLFQGRGFSLLFC